MTSIVTLLGILVALAAAIAAIYNSLVTKRVAVNNAWSQITVQLKRRHDLVPNLVNTVKGYASHEKDTLEAVIKARNAAVAAPSDDVASAGMAEGLLSGALRQIFALAEAYPDLKANENFLKLQGGANLYGESYRIRKAALQRLSSCIQHCYRNSSFQYCS